MAAMDCPAGVEIREGVSEVYVEAIARDGEFLELPFAGFSSQGIVDVCEGYYVDIIAIRITDGGGGEHSTWKDVPLDSFVLGWATDHNRLAPGRKVIFGLTDKDGHPIISPS